MKNLYLLTFILLIVTASCKKENIAKQSEYDASYKAWISFKNSSKNSYSHTMTFGSWTGYGVTINVGVNNGRIASRDFVSYKYHQDGTNLKDTIKQWHEDAATINTHPTDAGDAITMDTIYLKARNEWLKVDAKTNDILFEAKNKGMISSCGYVPHNCVDDCFRGISITAITAL